MESYNVEFGYLKQIFGFIGISDISFILAGGTTAVIQGKVSMEDFLAPFHQLVAEAAK